MEVTKLVTSIFLLGGENMVKINGTELDIAGQSITEYIASTSYEQKRIAVEKNGEIVPKAKYAEIILQDGDVLEVVCFVGGG